MKQHLIKQKNIIFALHNIILLIDRIGTYIKLFNIKETSSNLKY